MRRIPGFWTLPALVLFSLAVFACDGGEGGSTDSGRGDAGFDPTGYVNPFTGTGGWGQWGIGAAFPGAAAPSGMVKLSPDTTAITTTMSSSPGFRRRIFTGPA